MSTEPKNPIDVALQSPDPAIRHMALRRRAIAAETERIDSFLDLYSNLPSEGVVEGSEGGVAFSIHVDATPAIVLTDDFITMLRAALREAGKPLTLDQLFQAFIRRAPKNASHNKKSFRHKVYLNRNHIVTLGRNKGYWIAGEEIPKGGNDGP